MLYSDVVKVIEAVANPHLAAAWDKSGPQVAARRQETRKLAVCLDPLPGILRRALELGADCILSHHPLSLKPELPAKLDNWHEALAILLGADVPLYAAHTSLDVNLAGPAGWLARELKLAGLEPLERVGEGLCGYGLAGDLPAPEPMPELVARLLGLLHLEAAIASGPEAGGPIGRIAYCTGSGASLLEAARRAGAQLYVTGDIKYHAALEAEIPALDVGHHSLEEEMMKRFAARLADMLKPMQVVFVPSQSPFRILRESENE